MQVRGLACETRLDAGSSMTLVGTTTVRIPKDKCEDLEKLCLGLVMSDAAKAAASFTVGNVNDTATGDCQDFIVEGTTCDATVNAGELDCDGDGSGASKAYVSFSTFMISMYVVLKKLL
ncbi:uncharacterized protein [Ptychodera flava]|uniref:uncharacterized protein n=1 Tax=Ptychodera flava TaxID=63121 RepID=UPI00396A1FB9